MENLTSSADTRRTHAPVAWWDRIQHSYDERWSCHSLICYYCQHIISEIRAEISRSGRSAAAERIVTAIQIGQCACNLRNPGGAVCLGNVRQLVRRLSVKM